MTLIFKGILVGFILVLFVGPSFFYLIRVGITKGFKHAASFAFGIILSDLLFLLFIIKGISEYFENHNFQLFFSLIAGILITSIGVYSFFKKNALRIDENAEKKFADKKMGYFIKGFIINALNPFTFMVWLAVIGSVKIKWEMNDADFPVFVGSLLITVFGLDVMKAYLANYLGKIINEKTLGIVNRILGVIFIFLGVRLLFHFYKLYTIGEVALHLEILEKTIN